MEFYCPHCETAMCQECTNGEHGEHPTVPLKDVVEQHKASLQEQLGGVKQRYDSGCARASSVRLSGCLTVACGALRLPEINSALQTLSDILQQLTRQKSSIEDDIHSTFEELQKTLNVRKSVLLMELEVSYGLKQKVSCADATLSVHKMCEPRVCVWGCLMAD